MSTLLALRRLLGSSLALARTRAEFAAVELAQARVQLLRWFGLAATVLALATLALVSASALAVVLLWERLGWVTLAGLAMLYAVAALLTARHLARDVEDAGPLLGETLAQLRQDCDALAAARSAPGPTGAAR